MSYPPQPQQPYGQPPPHHDHQGPPYAGGSPPHGGQYGYPASQPGAYPAAGYYGQHPYAQQPYGQPAGFNGPPPRKSKTGLWVGLSTGGIALIAIGAFLFTYFLAPGFIPKLLINTSNPEVVKNEFLKRVNNGDAKVAIAFLCDSDLYENEVRDATRFGASLTAKSGSQGDIFASWQLDGEVGGTPIESGHIYLDKEKGSGFCVTTFDVGLAQLEGT